MILWEEVYKSREEIKRSKAMEKVKQLEFESIVKPIDEAYQRKLEAIKRNKEAYRKQKYKRRNEVCILNQGGRE